MTKQMIKTLSLMSLAAMLNTGCGDVGSTSAPLEVRTFKGKEFGLLDKGSLAISDTSVNGTGAIIARDPRQSDDNNYALSFSLEPGGSIQLVTNSNRKLETGVSLAFSRLAGTSFKVELAVGSEKYDLSSDFASFAADRPLRIEVDVHGHGHAVIWVGGQELEFAFTTRVAGNLWGLRLDKAALTEATAAKAKKDH